MVTSATGDNEAVSRERRREDPPTPVVAIPCEQWLDLRTAVGEGTVGQPARPRYGRQLVDSCTYALDLDRSAGAGGNALGTAP